MESWQTIKELFHRAVDIAPGERRVFLDAHCPDAEIRRQIENLFLAYEESADFISEPAIVEAGLFGRRSEAEEEAASRVGEKIGSYEIVREVGRGGMGAVYLAEHAGEGFRQRVALKIVKRGMDTDFILRRFRNERRLLAALNHPNIARLLGGGTTPDGLPYFVMEYVEGTDLISYCRRENLSLEAVLNLFRQVCAAVACAHQNLIVHRDLKPSNILVAADGTPKLLDFGIAKLLNDDPGDGGGGDGTTGVMRLFTPEYASPEQIRGEPVTTASDVYSLGVILYQILTARVPYQPKNKTYDEIVRAVCETVPEPPSSVVSRPSPPEESRTSENKDQRTKDEIRKSNPKSEIRNPKSLRGDLDNIVIKALQKAPGRRYSSVQEFSEDIRLFQAGLPVKAQPDRFAYRAAKFVRRHRAGVFAGLLIVLSLVGGLAATGWQAYRTNLERAKAERRFADVRALSNSLMLDVHDAIKDLPGSTPARRVLVEKALVYLDKIAREAEGEGGADDSALRGDLAVAYERVGDVQGNPQMPNLGDTTGALESYLKAARLREALPPEVRRTEGERYAAAALYGKIFQATAFRLDMGTAEIYCRRALALLEGLSDAAPENLDYRNALANSYSQLAELEKKDRRFEQALAHLKTAVAISDEVLRRDAGNAAALSNKQLAFVRAGEIHESAKDAPAALAAYRDALAAARKASDLYPQNAPLRLVLGISYGKVAYTQAALGDGGGALGNARAGLDILQKAVAADPENTFADRQLACAYKNVGLAHLQGGDTARALENFQKALAIKEKLREKDASDVYLAGDVGEIFAFHGDAYRKVAAAAGANLQSKREALRTAKNWYERSLAVWSEMQTRGKLPQYYSAKPDELKTTIDQCDEALRNGSPAPNE